MAVSVDGRVVTGSVPGSTHDLTLLRESGLLSHVRQDDGLAGDKSCIGLENGRPPAACYLPCKERKRHPLSEEARAYNRRLAWTRITIEHVFTRMNRFQALAQVWRHRRERHAGTFRVVAWLVDRHLAAAAM